MAAMSMTHSNFGNLKVILNLFLSKISTLLAYIISVLYKDHKISQTSGVISINAHMLLGIFLKFSFNSSYFFSNESII
jgi:hypothetical protein